MIELWQYEELSNERDSLKDDKLKLENDLGGAREEIGLVILHLYSLIKGLGVDFPQTISLLRKRIKRLKDFLEISK